MSSQVTVSAPRAAGDPSAEQGFLARLRPEAPADPAFARGATIALGGSLAVALGTVALCWLTELTPADGSGLLLTPAITVSALGVFRLFPVRGHAVAAWAGFVLLVGLLGTLTLQERGPLLVLPLAADSVGLVLWLGQRDLPLLLRAAALEPDRPRALRLLERALALDEGNAVAIDLARRLAPHRPPLPATESGLLRRIAELDGPTAGERAGATRTRSISLPGAVREVLREASGSILVALPVLAVSNVLMYGPLDGWAFAHGLSAAILAWAVGVLVIERLTARVSTGPLQAVVTFVALAAVAGAFVLAATRFAVIQQGGSIWDVVGATEDVIVLTRRTRADWGGMLIVSLVGVVPAVVWIGMARLEGPHSRLSDVRPSRVLESAVAHPWAFGGICVLMLDMVAVIGVLLPSLTFRLSFLGRVLFFMVGIPFHAIVSALVFAGMFRVAESRRVGLARSAEDERRRALVALARLRVERERERERTRERDREQKPTSATPTPP